MSLTTIIALTERDLEIAPLQGIDETRPDHARCVKCRRVKPVCCAWSFHPAIVGAKCEGCCDHQPGASR